MSTDSILCITAITIDDIHKHSERSEQKKIFDAHSDKSTCNEMKIKRIL